MAKKYEIVKDDTKECFGHTLYRIRALIAIGLSVSAGDLGGYVESEKNFSQDGDAWVSDNARVFGNAQVSGNSWVYGNAWVFGNARVFGNALAFGDAWVYGDARVFGNARASGDARVSGDTQIVWFSKVGSENGTLTVARSKNCLFVSRGCFSGTDIEFLSAVEKKHGFYSKIGREYQLLIEVARSRIDTITPITNEDCD